MVRIMLTQLISNCEGFCDSVAMAMSLFAKCHGILSSSLGVGNSLHTNIYIKQVFEISKDGKNAT